MGYEVSIIKKEMINASDKVIVLATSDKINGKMPHQVCGLDKIDAIVTELNPKSSRIRSFVEAGARVY
jgi:DeoR/GlpR family transcriptional regulator of sugar metabolism